MNCVIGREPVGGEQSNMLYEIRHWPFYFFSPGTCVLPGTLYYKQAEKKNDYSDKMRF